MKFKSIKLLSLILSINLILPLLYSCSSNIHKNWVEKYTGMQFVKIDSGRFYMGIPDGEAGQFRGAYYHEVEISKPFYIGKYEVTQGQWEKVMGDNPSYFNKLGKDYPVENINWFAANAFIDSLNKKNPGEKFILPTEAEWEYACRAGTTTPFSTGENITTNQANYYGKLPYKNFPAGIVREHPSPVGSFDPNPWGIYDMHGNVWEWCQDWFCDYPKSFR